MAIVVEAHGGDGAVLDRDLAQRRTQGHFPALRHDRDSASVVKIGQRHLRHAHTRAVAIGEHRLPENLHAVARIDAVEFLGKRADQHGAPEPADGRRRLLATPQPFQHGDAACFMKFRGIPFVLDDVEHGARDGELV